MRTNEQIAYEVLCCAIAHEPASKIVGNVSAMELAKIAAAQITACPKCGAEAWCNIDCDLCGVCSALEVHGDG